MRAPHYGDKKPRHSEPRKGLRCTAPFKGFLSGVQYRPSLGFSSRLRMSAPWVPLTGHIQLIARG